jgi:CheY-like chemotaxis protein
MFNVFASYSDNLSLIKEDSLVSKSGVHKFMYSYKTALLIDDDEIDTFINQKMLEITNFAKHIVVKNRASQAIEFLQANCSEPEFLPEYIFLDLNMPEMDGFEFLDAFDKLPENCKEKSKIIILSVTEDSTSLKKALDNKYVFKQVNKPLMKQSLTDLLEPAII